MFQAGVDLPVRTIITVFCGVGLYAAVFMLRKTKRAQRGELQEPSVVETPRARLFGGVPNALLGLLYYPAFAAAVWIASEPWELGALLAVSGGVALVSVVLAYSLLFITRMPCVYCWSAHVVNWSLFACNAFLLFKISYWR
ncbi:MAG: vitamin K epoxide reductase family protein [Candidatus Baltobacteraceae bacterium]